jgi:hypothetical protein
VTRAAKLAAVALLALALAACVAGSAEAQHAEAGGWIGQLLLGFWHGIIGPFMLIVEVVNAIAPHALPWTVRMYEPGATSVAYDVGFYFGLLGGPGAIFGGWRRRG